MHNYDVLSMYHVGFSLSIAVVSNGMVARALIKMTDLFSGLVELLQRRPSSYWLVLNSQGDHHDSLIT